jgi:hypothetical protein
MTAPMTRTDRAVRGYRGIRELRVTLEGPRAGFKSAPEVEGWAPAFIARHGADKVTYTYRAVVGAPCFDCEYLARDRDDLAEHRGANHGHPRTTTDRR